MACRTTPNDKKKKRGEEKKVIHTEAGIDLSIRRNCVHVSLAEGGFSVGRSLERIVQRPGGINSPPLSVDPTLGSKMNCRCYFNRGKEGEASRHFDGNRLKN